MVERITKNDIIVQNGQIIIEDNPLELDLEQLKNYLITELTFS